MNNRIFCRHEDHPHSLSLEEIKNPLAALHIIYNKQTPEVFKENLWAFFWSIYKDQLWKKNEPARLYGVYMDLTKLIDALWLIHKYYPKLSTPAENKAQHAHSSKLMRTFNLVFKIRQERHTEKEDGPKTVLGEFYNSHNLNSTKIDIYNYLQIALDAAYMRNDKYEYFCLADDEVVEDFLHFENLINEGQLIYSKGKTTTETPASNDQLKFACDADRTTMLNFESIASPMENIADIYDYYLNIDQVVESIKIWEKSFYEKDFWLHAENPGNMLFLCECLKKLVDCSWLSIQKRMIDINTPKKKLTNSRKRLYKSLNEQELEQPFLVLESFFAYKKMHEWKALLDEWTGISLSYTETIKSEDIGKTTTNLSYLIKFIEATHLLN